MRKVTVIPEKKLLVAQGGALIFDLDQAAAEYGLATGTHPQSFFTNSSEWDSQQYRNWRTYSRRRKGVFNWDIGAQ